MAFERRIIQDRQAIGDDIFIVRALGGNRNKLTPDPDSVVVPGTDINAAYLQPIEDFLSTLNTPEGTRLVVGNAAGNLGEYEYDYLCDGTNDAGVIQQAILDLPTEGGDIVLLPGHYKIKQTITIEDDRINLIGVGNVIIGGIAETAFQFVETSHCSMVGMSGVVIFKDCTHCSVYGGRYTYLKLEKSNDCLIFGNAASRIHLDEAERNLVLSNNVTSDIIIGVRYVTDSPSPTQMELFGIYNIVMGNIYGTLRLPDLGPWGVDRSSGNVVENNISRNMSRTFPIPEDQTTSGAETVSE
jgi:hypothetical protein